MDRKKVLVVSVHPDDETLGCGGTLLKHKYEGDNIYWLIITNRNSGDIWGLEKAAKRQIEIEKVAEMYSFEKVVKLDFPDARLDTVPFFELISKISSEIDIIKPHIVYVNNRSDIHSDHKVAFQAVLSSTKNFRFPYIKRVLMYECLSETEFAPALNENTFVPNVFVDVTDFMDKKTEIMSVYESELMSDYFPRSYQTIKALASYRGSRIGVRYAEAFQLLFEIL
jgi:N-acetylglucosamine malate deacetylase 1